MKLLTPVQITDALLISSSIAETDYPEWNASTAYTAGQRCILSATHSIYQRLVAGVTATSPHLDVANWSRVGPTNRWACFDQATGTSSTGTTQITLTIAPGLVRGLALLDLVGNSVTVLVKNGGTTIYSKTIDLNTGYGVASWDSYFFNEIVRRTTVVLTDIPPYANGQITVTVDGVGAVAVGTVAVGNLLEIGGSRYGVSLGIIDYSTKTTDAFGTTTITKRTYAKRMTVPVVIKSADVDEVARVLSLWRSTPAVWIGTEIYDQSVIFGFYKDWQIDIAYPVMSHCSLTIEGLT
jgi:hypothetical protein